MRSSIIQYILDKHLATLDAYKQKFTLYQSDIDIIKNFDGFKILENGNYWYKGHDIVIIGEQNETNTN